MDRRTFLTRREDRALSGVRLVPPRRVVGAARGERLSIRKGISIEFADHREYTEGDDLRHVDWSAFARLGEPVMKTYQDEQDQAVYVLIDGSASMAFGEPTKYWTAQKWGLALGSVALAGGESVTAVHLGQRRTWTRPLRGYSSLAQLAQIIGEPAPGSGDVVSGLRTFVKQGSRPGIAIVLSDGLSPEIAGAVRSLASAKHEVWWLQILAREELDPDLEGDLRLVDCESGAAIEITANRDALAAYRENLARHNDLLRREVQRVQGRHVVIANDDELERVLQSVMIREGWLERCSG